MRKLNKRINYFSIAGVSMLVVIIVVLILQNKQAIQNPDKSQIGKAELYVKNIAKPQGLTLDSQDRLFAQSATDGKISLINKDGRALDYTYLENYSGYGIDMDQNDNILMASYDSVIRIDSFGRRIQEFKGFKKVYDVKAAPDGTIFASDGLENRIYKISPKGDKTVLVDFGGQVSSSVLNAAGICLDKNNKKLYCVNMYTGDLYKISLTNDFQMQDMTVMASGLYKPNFIDVDDEGNVYVTCLGDNSVVRVDQNSIVEQIYTDSKLSAPSGIVFDAGGNNGGTLYVASKNTNRIYKFNMGIKNKGKK